MSMGASSKDNGKKEHKQMNSEDQNKMGVIPCDSVASRAEK